MAEAREWTEEFVAELYEINRYIVFRNLSTGTGSTGGRADADVAAFRRRGDSVEVCDIEVGTYYESAKSITGELVARFTDERKRYVLDAVRCAIDPENSLKARYVRVFVDASWATNQQFAKLKNSLESKGILCQSIEQLIDRAPADIRRWQQASMTPKGTEPQLPRSFKILQIIEVAHWVWKWERGWDKNLATPTEPPLP